MRSPTDELHGPPSPIVSTSSTSSSLGLWSRKGWWNNQSAPPTLKTSKLRSRTRQSGPTKQSTLEAVLAKYVTRHSCGRFKKTIFVQNSSRPRSRLSSDHCKYERSIHHQETVCGTITTGSYIEHVVLPVLCPFRKEYSITHRKHGNAPAHKAKGNHRDFSEPRHRRLCIASTAELLVLPSAPIQSQHFGRNEMAYMQKKSCKSTSPPPCAFRNSLPLLVAIYALLQ